MPRVPPSMTGASGCCTDVSTMTQAPLGRSFRQDLQKLIILIRNYKHLY